MLSVEELKEERPELVEFFESLSHDKLLEQIYKEVVDAVNMEERVDVFMQECTDNMSKTNYTPSTIRGLISAQKEKDLRDFCEYLIEGFTDSEILKEIKQMAGVREAEK
jgi:hypothetical protein